MVVLGGGAVLYERGTPVGLGVAVLCGHERARSEQTDFFFLLFDSQPQGGVMHKSMRLTHEPASEPLHISANQSLSNQHLFRFCQAANILRVIRRGAHAMYKRGASPNPPQERRVWHPGR